MRGPGSSPGDVGAASDRPVVQDTGAGFPQAHLRNNILDELETTTNDKHVSSVVVGSTLARTTDVHLAAAMVRVVLEAPAGEGRELVAYKRVA